MPQPTTTPQYAEEPCFYVYTVALTANQILRNQNVPIDLDSDFMLTGIHGTNTGAFLVNFRLPSGRNFCNQQIHSANFLGTANQPAAIGPAPVYIAGGVGPVLELTDLSGAGNTLELIFSGIRRFTLSS